MKRGHRTVLVVDDTEIYHELLSFLLEGEGIQIKSAYNGNEALEYLEAHEKPALIILDLEMPIMNGYEFYSEMKSNENLQNIPVVVYSGIICQFPIKLQVAARITKGEPTEKLIEVIRRYCK